MLSALVTHGWRDAARVSVATLGTSLVLALIFGLLSRPTLDHLRFNAHATLVWVGWVWESIFGVSAVGHAHASGSLLSIARIDAHGSITASGFVDGMPLTLTLITLFVAVRAFRKSCVGYTRDIEAFALAGRSALVIALVLLLASFALSLNANDLLTILNTKPGTHHGLATVSRLWQSLGGQQRLTVGVSSLEAFLVSFALVLGVLSTSSLTRLSPRRPSWVCDLVTAPVRVTARLLLALMISGWLYALVTWQVRLHTAWPPDSFGGRGHPPHLPLSEWVNYIAAAIAYGVNIGMVALGLGSGSSTGWTTSYDASVSGLSINHPAGAHHALAWWATSSHLATGVWLAVVLAPAILGYVAWRLARDRADPRVIAQQLGIWVLTMIPAVALTTYLTNVSMGASASGHVSAGWLSGSVSAHASAGFELPILTTTALVTCYALVVSAVVWWVRWRQYTTSQTRG